MTTLFPATCPICGYQVDAHSAVGEHDAIPSDGAISICIACGEPSVFTAVLGGALALRRPTPAERDDILRDDTVISVMLAHRQAREQDPNWPRGRLAVIDEGLGDL